MSLLINQLVGFNWSGSAAAATATATATATGAGSSVAVTTVGSNSQGSSGSTQTFTVPAGGIPSGSTIIIAAGNGSLRTISSITDTKGNSYTVGLQKNNASDVQFSLAYAQNVTAMVSGDIITINLSGSASNRVVVVAYATGLTTGTLIDKNASAAGTSTTPSSGASGVTTVATEAVIGVVARGTANVTEASGYTGLGNVGAAVRLNLAYKVVTSTGAQTYNPTLSASVFWACGVETLKT